MPSRRESAGWARFPRTPFDHYLFPDGPILQQSREHLRMFNFFLDCGEAILINHDILVRVLEIRDGEVVLGIESPGDTTVVRGENYAEAGLALADFER